MQTKNVVAKAFDRIERPAFDPPPTPPHRSECPQTWQGGRLHHDASNACLKNKNKKKCRHPGSNWGPLDLQSSALPTELYQL